MKYRFHLPDKNTAKGKSVTVIFMACIIVALYAVSYMLFLRTIDVDVTANATIVYNGESGSATIKVVNESKVYNQRIQEFMDSIYYEVNPNHAVSNGDVIVIKAFYDKDIARRYNIHPINKTRQVKVQDLPIKFETAKEIPETYFSTISKRGKNYLKDKMDMILSDDFTSFVNDTQPKLQNYALAYRVYLQAFNEDVKDKVIDVYAIEAKGEVKTGEDSSETKSETIYYMITYNEINTSLKILDENVYGEKIIVNGDYNLANEDDFKRYFDTKYQSQYEITYLQLKDANKKDEEQTQ